VGQQLATGKECANGFNAELSATAVDGSWQLPGLTGTNMDGDSNMELFTEAGGTCCHSRHALRLR